MTFWLTKKSTSIGVKKPHDQHFARKVHFHGQVQKNEARTFRPEIGCLFRMFHVPRK